MPDGSHPPEFGRHETQHEVQHLTTHRDLHLQAGPSCDKTSAISDQLCTSFQQASYGGSLGVCGRWVFSKKKRKDGVTDAYYY